jgi:hypothetical protein
VALRRQGKEAEAIRDFARSLKINRDMRLMIDLHIMELELQIREMQRRRALNQERVA